MNTSIIVNSLKYLQKFEIVSLSSWIYELLININYSDSKLCRSYKKWDYEISNNLMHRNNNPKILDDLLSYNSGYVHLTLDPFIEIQKDNYYLLEWFSYNGYTEAAKYMIPKVTRLYEYALICACHGNHAPIVKILLDLGTQIHNRHDFLDACHYGFIEVVTLLLDYGADIHTDDDYCVKLAIKEGHVEILKLLLDRGARVSDDAIQMTTNDEMLKLLITRN